MPGGRPAVLDPSDNAAEPSQERSGPPEWKEQLRERVRAIRERRGAEAMRANPSPGKKESQETTPAPSPERPVTSEPAQRRGATAETTRGGRRSGVEHAEAPKRVSEGIGSLTPDAHSAPVERESRSSPRQEKPSISRGDLPAEDVSRTQPFRQEDLLLEEIEAFDPFQGEAREDLIRHGQERAAELQWEGTQKQIASASLVRRMVARLLDVGVIAFSSIPFVALVEIVYGDFSRRPVQIALAGVVLLIGILYETIMLSGAGRTVGMAAMGLLALNARTMDLPSAGQAVRHILGQVLGVLPVFFGFFWALLNRERRTFADLLAGIIVLRVDESVYESQEIHAPWLYRPARRR